MSVPSLNLAAPVGGTAAQSGGLVPEGLSRTATTTVPVIGETRGVGGVPDSVRNGSAAVKQAYASAQGFEEMLLQQLSQTLVQSSGLSGESEANGEGSGEEGALEGGGGAPSSMLSSMLPQTLADGVMHAGGLGLAAQLVGALDHAVSSTPAAAASASATIDPAGGASAGLPATAASVSATSDPTGGASAGLPATPAITTAGAAPAAEVEAGGAVGLSGGVVAGGPAGHTGGTST